MPAIIALEWNKNHGNTNDMQHNKKEKGFYIRQKGNLSLLTCFITWGTLSR